MANLVHTITTRNYDLITVTQTNEDYYEVYFNGLFIAEHMFYREALKEVENQLSL